MGTEEKMEYEATLKAFIGGQIKSRRKFLKMTQTDLAERTGSSKSKIAQYERGYVFPPLTTLVACCELFKCSVNELVLGEDAAGLTRQEKNLIGLWRKLQTDDREDILAQMLDGYLRKNPSDPPPDI